MKRYSTDAVYEVVYGTTEVYLADEVDAEMKSLGRKNELLIQTVVSRIEYSNKEIARLIESYNKAVDPLEDDVKRQKEEIARLRKALNTLFNAATNVLGMVRDTYCSDERGPDDRCSLLENAIKIASEVLAEKE